MNSVSGQVVLSIILHAFISFVLWSVWREKNVFPLGKLARHHIVSLVSVLKMHPCRSHLVRKGEQLSLSLLPGFQRILITEHENITTTFSITVTSWACYRGTMTAPTLFSFATIDSSLLFKSSRFEKRLVWSAGLELVIRFSLVIWDICYCIQWKKESGHQSERERLECKVIFTLRIMAHVFSPSLSTWWLYCVVKNDEKLRQEWKRRYSWEKDIKDAGESICGPGLDEDGVEVTVLDVQTGMWRT